MQNWQILQQEFLPHLESLYTKEQERFFGKSAMRPMLDGHFSTGGKRLRPLCAWHAAKESNPTLRPEHVAPYALAVELIHNATLIHDDIQDEDRLRRGKPTLWVEHGLAQAINCGDAWFFSSQLLVQNGPYEDFEKIALLKILQEKTLAVIEGQSQEFVLKEKFQKGNAISRSAYEEMAAGKTSALFSMPLLGGALLGGASALQLEEIERGARSLGLAFQIQDDLLDLWGEKGREAKGADIAEGKLSFPVVLALTELKEKDKLRLEAILRKSREHTSKEEVQEAIELLSAVKEKAKALFSEQIKMAEEQSILRPIAAYLSDLVKAL